jgi:hypothetical protein
MAEIVRRRSRGGVSPRGRTPSISGSHTAQAASVKIRISPLLSAERRQIGTVLKR